MSLFKEESERFAQICRILKKRTFEAVKLEIVEELAIIEEQKKTFFKNMILKK